MWRNYLTVALRTLANNRAYAAISIGGLALGLAACLFILTYIRYERSYDAWLPQGERIYQVQASWHHPGQPVARSQNSPLPLRDTLMGGFPQIEAITVMRSGPTVTMRGGEAVEVDSTSVDPSFFDIFELPFAAGSAAGALPDTNSIVLTRTEALRQFGETNVVGRTMSLGAGGGRRDYLVTGVLEDLPKNTNLKFGILFRNNPSELDAVPAQYKGWDNMGQQHYVKLRSGADAAAINAAFPAWEKRTVAPRVVDGRPMSQADIMDLALVPLGKVHLGAAQAGALTTGGDPRALATFMIVALLALGMAVMNFVNLSTARSTQRAREIALRKVLGARRSQLVVQLLLEALLMAASAILLALALIEVAAPWIAQRLDVDLRITYLGSGGILLPALGLLLATGLLGGLYPAFHLSRLPPAQALRANKASADTPGSGRLRTGLVVLQFAIAIGLIVSTIVIHSQTRYVETVDPGYRRDGLIQIDSAWRFGGSERYEPARAQLLAIPGVTAVGRANLGLAAENRNVQPVRRAGAPGDLSFGVYSADPGFFRVMDLRLLAGRFLGDREAKDRVPVWREGASTPESWGTELSARGLNIVINRTAARMLGFAVPGAAVGKTIRTSVAGRELVPCTIVGVVEDTRVRSARDALEPLIYNHDPGLVEHVIVRYAAARPGEVIDGIETVWRRFEPEIPFKARFAEDIVAKVYAADRARGALFAAFAALAVLIACLGLYSLAAFATERRTKEIGIRKVVGATVRDIVRLLAWQFSKPVVISNMIAWPIAWWSMTDWLNEFDVRIALTPFPFLLAAAITIAIAVLTVAGHALKVARANPIHALRYE